MRRRGPFRDRTAAGSELAASLVDLSGEWVALGIPRGGVALAAVVADERSWPLDVVVVQKVGFPGQPELGVAALAEGGALVPNPDLVPAVISHAQLEGLAAATMPLLEERIAAFRAGHPPIELEGRAAVIIDDGIATGVSTLAAVRSVRARGAQRIVLAVPVAPRQAHEMFHEEVDQLVVLETPRFFQAVGSWYDDFSQVPTEVVVELLDQHRKGPT